MNLNAQIDEPAATAALLRAANGFVLLFWGAILWLLFWSELIQLPLLARRGFPINTLPALLWLLGAWNLHRAEGGPAAWRPVARGLLAAALIHASLLPYLGWWQAVVPRWYQLFNTILLAGAIAAGVVLTLALVFQLARWLDDRVLRIEAILCCAGIPLIILLMTGLIVWSAHRISAELRLADWIDLLRASPRWNRLSTGAMLVMPMLPLLALMWEARERIHAWLPARRAPDEQA